MIRVAELNDSKAIAKIIVETWNTTYQNIIPDEYLNQISYSKVEERTINNIQNPNKTTIVFLDNEKIVGFASFGLESESNNHEVYALYVYKEYQKKNIGTKLLLYIFNEIKHGKIVIWTLKDNSANSFYQKLGGVKVDERITTYANKPLIEYKYLFDIEKIKKVR